VGALVGFLAVFGVAVRAGLVVMRDMQAASVTSDPETPRSESVQRAVRRSVFPTVVSAVGLALLALPFAVAGDVAGMEVMRPLALVVLGGMVSTLLVTLVLLPAAYLRWFAGDEPAPLPVSP
jgi:Cu/Ag efflux pump CusA